LNVLTRIFGLERKEETGCAIQLHTEASHNLQLSLRIIMMACLKECAMGGACTTYGIADKVTHPFGSKKRAHLEESITDLRRH
jgi:hypothetical protein